MSWVRIILSIQRLQCLCVGCLCTTDLQLQISASLFLGSARFYCYVQLVDFLRVFVINLLLYQIFMTIFINSIITQNRWIIFLSGAAFCLAYIYMFIQNCVIY